jgi:hypothetical protein
VKKERKKEEKKKGQHLELFLDLQTYVQSQTRVCGLCGAKSVTGTDFSPSISV